MPGKRIQFDDDTLSKLNELGRRRMATFQELADEAFADLMKKHHVPLDLRDALKKSVRAEKQAESVRPRKREVARSGTKRATRGSGHAHSRKRSVGRSDGRA